MEQWACLWPPRLNGRVINLQHLFDNRKVWRQRRGMVFYDTHLELQEGEIFLCLANDSMFELLQLQTARKGEHLLDSWGHLKKVPGWYPVFVGTAELEAMGVVYTPA